MVLSLFKPKSALSLRGFITRMVLGLLVLNSLVVSLAAWSIYQSRLKYVEDAGVQARNLTLLIDHDISSSISSVDLTLQSTAQEIGAQLGKSSLAALDLSHFIAQQVFEAPDLSGLRVADAQGNLTHGTGVVQESGVSIADRDYFVRLRSEPDTGLVVSEPILGRISGQWGIGLARAIHRPDGSFAGVVVGAIPLTRFTAIFDELAVGQGGTFTLFDDALRVITRRPLRPGAMEKFGRKINSPVLEELMASNRSEASYVAASNLDGLDRMYSVRRLKGVPLNISVGLSTQDFLRLWRTDALKTIAFAVVFMLTTMLLFWLSFRAWRKEASSAAALKDANRTLAAEKELNQTIIQSSPFAIYTRDRNGIVTAWNMAAERLFGWRADEVVGHTLRTLPPGKEQESLEIREKILRGENIIQLEVQRQKRDGTLFDLSTTLAPLRGASGANEGYLAIALDVTERKAAERQIEFLAYRDVLTGLPNRRLLHDRFEQAVAYAERDGSQVGLLFLDLDNFKTINDSLGHLVGDALLKEVARRLGECVRETDTISRQGGDEFLVLLPDLHGNDAITPVLSLIREKLLLPFELEGHELTTSASVGVSLYPGDGKDFDTLLRKADTAMYQTKDSGRNGYRFFNEQMNDQAVENLQLKNGLRGAITRNEFVLHYQPQIDLQTGKVVGVEALIRWNHPERGMILPGRFIPLAEDSGLIVPIGEWVLHEACRQAVEWQKVGLPSLVMAVNLSAVQFKRGDVEQVVTRALQATGFDPRFLELELTESILIHNTDNVLASVKRLKQMGVTLSIDDFGTGYSSLSYLKRFDVDKLKIDQSFIRDLATDPDDAAIIRAIIQMARSLNLKTIAEGVEDGDMLAQLRTFNCDEAQGYHFARPMPAQSIVNYLRGEWGAADLTPVG
jgi:diguanylate cyclase (GGDEF)-like protein/PAS domain S-box-containing protein